MIKRRKPDKIKPGTPHPTKAYTTRGFNGRWISTKSYNADRRRREKAAKEVKSNSKTTKSTSKTTPKKGGSLVKRVSSALSKTSNKAGELLKVKKGALTKASDKAGELLKIKKGDKGLVRGVKDLYKMGKDTRKTANALYKAGKITREVHDKLVKGGKDFFGGVKESGKAVKRVANALKPGGKLVAQAKKFNGVNYNLIPKSIRGALAKVSTDGGKSKTFKFDYNQIPKDLKKKTPTRFKAPKTRMPRKGKLVVDGKTVYTKRDIKGDVKNKAAGVKSNLKKNVNKGKDAVKQRAATTRLKFSRPNASSVKANALKMNKYLKGNFNAKSLAGGLAKGGLYLGADALANLAADKLILNPIDRLTAKKLGITVEELQARKEQAKKRSLFSPLRSNQNKLNTTAPDGKLSFGNQPKSRRNWQNPHMGPKQPEISFKPEKETPGPNQGTDSTKKEKVDQPKVKVVQKQPKKVSVGNVIGAYAGVDKKSTKKEDKPKNKLKTSVLSKVKKALKPGFSERQLESQIRSLKRGSKGPSNRMKIKRLQELKKKKYG